MADNKRRGRFGKGGDDTSSQSIFDLFEPPPDRDAGSFGKIPIIRDDEELDLNEVEFAEAKRAAEAEAAGLRHWTEPATGMLPAALAADGPPSFSDLKGPSWQGEEPNWDGPDLSDVFAEGDAIRHDRMRRPARADRPEQPKPAPGTRMDAPGPDPAGRHAGGHRPAPAGPMAGDAARRAASLPPSGQVPPSMIPAPSAGPAPSSGVAPPPVSGRQRLRPDPRADRGPDPGPVGGERPGSVLGSQPNGRHQQRQVPPSTLDARQPDNDRTLSIPAAHQAPSADRAQRPGPSGQTTPAVSGHRPGALGGSAGQAPETGPTPAARSPRPPSLADDEAPPARPGVAPGHQGEVQSRGHLPAQGPGQGPGQRRLSQQPDSRQAQAGHGLQAGQMRQRDDGAIHFDQPVPRTPAEPGRGGVLGGLTVDEALDELGRDGHQSYEAAAEEDYDDGHADYQGYEEYEPDYGDDAGTSAFVRRLLVGVVLAAVVFTVLFFGPEPTMVLIGLLTLVATMEVFNGMRAARLRPATLLGLVGSVALPAAAFVRGEAAYPLVIGLAVVFGMLWYLTGADTERPVLNLGLTLIGVLWIGGLAGFGALMVRGEDGTGLLAATIIITAASDTMAYLGGRSYGNRPFHYASPNKTWEGTLTGFFGALLAGLVLGVTDLFGVFQAQFVSVMVLAAVVGVLAPIGDLAESLVKRDLGLKDMGTILPGHGGALDRVDGLLFALPGAYYVAVIYQLI